MQFVHAVLAESVYEVPATQAWQLPAAEPDHDPAAHGVQSEVSPDPKVENVPALQFEQDDNPAEAEYLPAAHGVQTPEREYVPAGQLAKTVSVVLVQESMMY